MGLEKEQSNKSVGNPQSIIELFKDVPVVNVAPTTPPKYKTAITLYDDGAGDRRVYFYFNGVWGYASLT
jgi:hypothetical protein